MRRIVLLLALTAAAITAGASVASAGFIQDWGDWEVHYGDQLIPTDAFAFQSDSANTNPTGWPAPSATATGDTHVVYPNYGVSETLTVGEYRSYLAGLGLPTNKFAILMRTESNNFNGNPTNTQINGGTDLCNLRLYINGVIVADAIAYLDGELHIPDDTTYGFIADLDLSSFSNTDVITQLRYRACTNTVPHVTEVEFAATPEPVSMAFLGTGLVGTILIRRRKRKA